MFGRESFIASGQVILLFASYIIDEGAGADSIKV